MDQRIKELAEQAGFSVYEDGWVEGCIKSIEHLEKIIRADEREICAKLCESLAQPINGMELMTPFQFASTSCAAAIRQRGEK